MEIYYAGIGSRTCPEEVLAIMVKLGYVFAKKGFVLRSGAAEGSDSAFEKGADQAGGKKEIYLPWKNFNNHPSELYNHPQIAEEIAFQHHYNLYAQKESVIKLMTRNSMQIFGKNIGRNGKEKVKFVVCYCPVNGNGTPIGGTSQALRIAEANDIPIFNLFFREKLQELKDFVAELESKENGS